MSHEDDFLDLPVAPEPKALGASPQRVEVALEVTAETAAVVRTLFEIWKIRTEADGDVARVRAETERLREAYRGELELLRGRTDRVRANGDVLIDLLRQAPDVLREAGDPETRRAFIESLPALAAQALRDEG